GHGFLQLLISSNEQSIVSGIQAWTLLPEESWILAYALLVGFLASMIPAWTAYKTSIARQLTRA
ncbi:MAG: putative ABC transport system permease protein, partial [Planctomycetota bacterium]